MLTDTSPDEQDIRTAEEALMSIQYSNNELVIGIKDRLLMSQTRNLLATCIPPSQSRQANRKSRSLTTKYSLIRLAVIRKGLDEVIIFLRSQLHSLPSQPDSLCDTARKKASGGVDALRRLRGSIIRSAQLTVVDEATCE